MTNTELYISYEDRITELVAVRPVPEMSERFSIIDEIGEEYYSQTGNSLPPMLLSMLSDWILIEILKDKSVDKVTNTDFAILSHRQLKRRDNRENSVEGEVMDYLNLKYRKNKDSLSKKTHKEIDY